MMLDSESQIKQASCHARHAIHFAWHTETYIKKIYTEACKINFHKISARFQHVRLRLYLKIDFLNFIIVSC